MNWTRQRDSPYGRRMTLATLTDDNLDFLHEIGSRMAAADPNPLHEVLEQVVEFIVAILKCDSCFVYVREDDQLVLRASKNSHPEVVDQLKIPVGEGITGWVAERLEPVAVPRNAWEDPRFKPFAELPEDRFEAFLSVPVLSRGHLVGVINVQHRPPHTYTLRQIKLISTVGFLVGAEIEAARLESEVSQLSRQLEARKVLERAKGILQRELGISEEEAYLTLQRQSRQRRKPMKDVAEAIVLSEEVRRGQEARSKK